MAEWQIERGIGETRAILVDGDHILETRLHWHGELIAGSVVNATLVSKTAGSKRGTARLEDGIEVLVDRLANDITEGAELQLEIVRSPIGERGRLKMAHARPTAISSGSLSLHESLANTPYPQRELPRFTVPGWNDIIGDALAQNMQFDGGSLLLAPTPAMLVIDIDGTLPHRELALAAIPSIANALMQFDIGGMVAIDFPTLPTKVDRRLVDEALEKALGDWPHERTAMNGFGLVQLISRLERPSLVHRASTSRIGLLVRQLLRQAEHVATPGAIMLTVHPALKPKLKSDWLEELARRTGREVRIEVSPTIALEGSFAQAVPL